MDTSTRKTLDYYDTHAETVCLKYEATGGGTLSGWVLRQTQPLELILELGCGSGRDAAFLKQHKRVVIGLDGSRAMLNQSLSLHPDLEGFLFQAVLPGPLPFRSQTFRLILASAVLMHFPREGVVNILGELKRIIQHHGLLCLSVSLSRPDVGPDGFDIFERFFLRGDIDDWKSLLYQQGWTIKEAWIEPDQMGRKGLTWANFCLIPAKISTI